jgi:hypothetical protein
MMLREPWRTRLLIVSFAVNLLLIPLAGARLWAPRATPLTPGLPRTEIIIDHMVRDLPPGDAERFRATMEEHLGGIDSARVRMLAARNTMSRAIGRTPYDPVLLQDAMHKWQTAWTSWSETLGQAMLDALPALSTPGREALAAMGKRRPPPGGLSQ